MKRTVPGLLVVGLLLLGPLGCDSGGDDDSGEQPAFAGRWSLQSLSLSTYLTIDQEQTILDPLEEGAGGLHLTGEVDTTLRYMRFGVGESDERVVFVSDVPVTELGYSSALAEDDAILLELVPSGEPNQYDAFLFAPNGRYDADEPLTLEEEVAGVAIDSVVFRSAHGTVTVVGTIAGATQTLPAGEATRASETSAQVPDGISFIYTFEADGTLLIVQAAAGGGQQAGRAQWRLEGDTLVVFGTDAQGDRYEELYTYEVDGNTLLLEANVNACSSDSNESCRRTYEDIYGLSEGSLQAAQVTYRFRFARSAAGSNSQGSIAGKQTGDVEPDLPSLPRPPRELLPFIDK